MHYSYAALVTLTFWITVFVRKKNTISTQEQANTKIGRKKNYVRFKTTFVFQVSNFFVSNLWKSANKTFLGQMYKGRLNQSKRLLI